MEREIDRTPKPCLHPKSTHEHGTRNCYTLDGCRCYPCSWAVSDYNYKLRTGQICGHYTDAEPVRQRVLELMAAGVGFKRIAALSGVSTSSVGYLLYGKRGKPIVKFKTESARKILALVIDREPEQDQVEIKRAAGARASSVGTTRRIQALVMLGWSQNELARRLGLEPSNFVPLVHGRRQVLQSTADRVAALYEELSMKHPPEETPRQREAVRRVRRYAQKHRWLPPLAWDDELIDDPDYQPVMPKDTALSKEQEIDEAAIERRMAGEKKIKLSVAGKDELVRRWIASGRPLNECERLTGINPHRHTPKTPDQEQGAA